MTSKSTGPRPCSVHHMHHEQIVRDDTGDVILSYFHCRDCDYMEGFDPDDANWYSGMTVCRICGYRMHLFWPESADETALKCGGCGNMTAEPTE